MQYTAIALTYKIKAAGSRQAGEIMVSMFFVFMCCVGCVYCNHAFIMMYGMLGHSNLVCISQVHPTQLLPTAHRTGSHMTQQKK
jgi:hypothetical protein